MKALFSQKFRTLPDNLLSLIWHWILLFCVAILAIQLFFMLKIASFAFINPSSTSFERSQIWQLIYKKEAKQNSKSSAPQNASKFKQWRQQWRDSGQISVHLKRAVIAAEDVRFMQHYGVDWQSLKGAIIRYFMKRGAGKGAEEMIVGGSSITQQLVKNLFFSAERSLLRKIQEIICALWMDVVLSKERILEIYLNHAEWGEGIFGAQAAAKYYFNVNVANLTPWQAAQLAVLLPRPRKLGFLLKSPKNAYKLHWRANIVLRRMPQVTIPLY